MVSFEPQNALIPVKVRGGFETRPYVPRWERGFWWRMGVLRW